MGGSKTESLAECASESVRCSPARNAIEYLAQNIEQGIVTPLLCRE